MHGALGQSRLNFLKRKFFNYKTGPNESIDDVSSELSRMQMIIKDIKSSEASTDLNIAFILINFIDHETYTMAKYHFEDMEDLTLAHIKKRLKFVKQRIKNETNATNESANKAEPDRQKKNRKCFFCDKKGHMKKKCFKWLTTDEGKKFAAEKGEKAFTKQEPTNQKKSAKKGKKENARTAQKKEDAKNSNDV